MGAAVALLVALLLVGCGGGGDGEGGSSEAEPLISVEGAGWQGLKSGELHVLLQFGTASGSEVVGMQLQGKFLHAAGERLARFDMALEAFGKLERHPVQFFASLLRSGDHAVVNYAGSIYQLDPAAFGLLEAVLAKDGTACFDRAAALDLPPLLEDPKAVGRTDEAGTAVFWVEADLDVSGAIEALEKLADDPVCGRQLRALAPHPLGALFASPKAFAEATREATVSLGVDQHHLLRNLTLNWVMGPHGGEGEATEFEFSFSLEDVNRTAALPGPLATAPFPALLRQFGLRPEAIREANPGGALIAVLAVLGRRLTGRDGS